MDTLVYIDGFNLYYNAVKNTPYKWLDLFKLAELMFPRNNILKVKYFTAYVRSFDDPNQLFRQKIYLKALKTLYGNNIEIYRGHFTTYWKYYRLARRQEEKPEKDASNQRICVIKNEEKRSDVNLAVHLVNDAWKDLYEAAVIISNDSDLEQALKIVHLELGKVIGLVNPKVNSECCGSLNQYASFHGRITKSLLCECQLPDTIPDTNITRPEKWN